MLELQWRAPPTIAVSPLRRGPAVPPRLVSHVSTHSPPTGHAPPSSSSVTSGVDRLSRTVFLVVQ